MGEVSPFEKRRETTTTAAIREDLAGRGSARCAVDDLLVSVAVWRKLARAVGRELGRPVQTIVMGDDVHAVLRDWPATPEERAQRDADLRAVVNAMPKLQVDATAAIAARRKALRASRLSIVDDE